MCNAISEVYLEAVDGPNPSGWCKCGCGGRTNLAPKTVTRNGYVRGTPMSYLTGHRDVSMLPPHYIVDATTGCWNWQRSVTKDGYGHLRQHGVLVKAHRVYWERENGPVPAGLVLDHLCRNPRCCNPAHLEPVTNAENCQRGIRASLNPDSVREIRRRMDEGERSTVVGPAFGVTRYTAERVYRRVSWKDVA